MFLLSLLVALIGSTATVLSAPSASVTSNAIVDSNGIYFVSYDGLVNVNSFEISGLFTFNNYQYVTWYSSNRYAQIGRRKIGTSSWSVVQLNHQLSVNDSHNVVVVGISPSDGKIHIALDCHSTALFYISSVTGLATNPDTMSWSSSQFSSASTTLGGINLGSQITYPQFVITPQNRLQLSYRTGISGNGQAAIAEYNNGAWSIIGRYTSSTGTYTGPNGVTSSTRNLYINGFTYRNNRLHTSGTWREGNSGVLCNSGGLTNHDTAYAYSDDYGRTWKNSGGNNIATTGGSLLSISSSNIIVDNLDPNHGLMNQESMAIDSSGLPHIIISYIPGRFKQCVTSYQNDRISYGYPFHVWKNSTGAWTKTEIPFPIKSVGRSQAVLDSNDNLWVVLPYVKVVVSTKAGGYRDWSLAYDGSSSGTNLGAFGEVVVDRTRIPKENIVSVLYQKGSSGSSSEVHVIDFTVTG